MRRFYHLVWVGLKASVVLCFALTALRAAVLLICLIPFVQKLLEHTFLADVVFIIYGWPYYLFALCITAGQFYSFLIYRNRQIPEPSDSK